MTAWLANNFKEHRRGPLAPHDKDIPYAWGVGGHSYKHCSVSKSVGVPGVLDPLNERALHKLLVVALFISCPACLHLRTGWTSLELSPNNVSLCSQYTRLTLRQVLGLDVARLKCRRWNDVMVVLAAKDSNHRIIVVATGLVTKGSADHCRYFLGQ